VASGELTPTLKVRREVIASRYGDLIEELYAIPHDAGHSTSGADG
jgi:long-subunit acyl-CoA synthetase (AMP-forming)